jgi:8-oxo-dGTP diphosphatase
MSKKNGEKPRPLTGVGVMIFEDGQVLMSVRKGSHGEGEYSFPGGHLEFGESFEKCARREVLEEAGIEIDNIRFQYLANVKKYDRKHYVHIGLLADWKNGEPQILEPDKNEKWQWYSLDKLPKPLFEMCRLSFISLQTGQNYFDS